MAFGVTVKAKKVVIVVFMGSLFCDNFIISDYPRVLWVWKAKKNVYLKIVRDMRRFNILKWMAWKAYIPPKTKIKVCVLIVKWWFHRNHIKNSSGYRQWWCETTGFCLTSFFWHEGVIWRRISSLQNRTLGNKGTPWIENESFVIHYLPERSLYPMNYIFSRVAI